MFIVIILKLFKFDINVNTRLRKLINSCVNILYIMCIICILFLKSYICYFLFVYRNDEQLLSTHYCNGNATEYQFYGNERSNSEFFVTTGVLSFLYATILIVVFLFSEKLYSENPKAPIVVSIRPAMFN